MQLYTQRAGWLYLLEMRACEDPFFADVPFFEMFVCQTVERNNSEILHKRNDRDPSIQAAMCTDPFLSAVIRTYNPFGHRIGA